MKRDKKIEVGSLVKNGTTGVIGSVIEIIGDSEKPFGYIVKTRKGVQRWVIKRSKSKKQST